MRRDGLFQKLNFAQDRKEVENSALNRLSRTVPQPTGIGTGGRASRPKHDAKISRHLSQTLPDNPTITTGEGSRAGELTFSGRKTSLYLYDKDLFITHPIPYQYIKGVLNDLTKVSLIDCITTSGTGSRHRGQEQYHFATVFPHFVVYGEEHLVPDQETINEVHFVVDDARRLFYDFEAFGSLIDARPFIESIANANDLQNPYVDKERKERKVTIGPDPAILYFTGKREIFAADTVLGRVSATHNPTQTLGGPNWQSQSEPKGPTQGHADY